MEQQNQQWDRVVESGVLEPPEVHEAAGMLAVRHGVAVAEAIAGLRRHAASLGRPMSTVALAVIDRRTGRPTTPDGP